jgi:twinkle protein
MQIYDDGTGFCFSCRQWYSRRDVEAGEEQPAEEPKVSPKDISGFSKVENVGEIQTYPVKGFKERTIPLEICKFYGVRVSYGSDGKIDKHYYPYHNESSYKVRRVAEKQFYWINKQPGLFGKDRFQAGGRRVIIAEGEIDVLSISRVVKRHYKRFYPVVGLAAATFVKDLIEERDWLRSFNEIVIAFDMDKAGREATEEAIRILGIDKVRIAKFEYKDPNEVLLKQGPKKLLQDLFDAARHIPDGIITKEELWDAMEAYNNVKSIPYPACIDGLNDKAKGMRFGEITLFISGTGSGKSTMLREIIIHINKQTEYSSGILSLEESPAESARLLSGMMIERNPADEEIPLEDLRPGFDQIFGDDRVRVIDHQGSMNDDSIMDRLEYLCLIGCKFIFIDHVTILASEGVESLMGNEAIDKIMNNLARLVKRHNVWIGLVSHLRKSNTGGKAFEEGKMPSVDDIRGSGSIKQVSYDIIGFARDMTADQEIIRNTIKMSVLKCRHSGLTGPTNGSRYDFTTGRLKFSETLETEFVAID